MKKAVSITVKVVVIWICLAVLAFVLIVAAFGPAWPKAQAVWEEKVIHRARAGSVCNNMCQFYEYKGGSCVASGECTGANEVFLGSEGKPTAIFNDAKGLHGCSKEKGKEEACCCKKE